MNLKNSFEDQRVMRGVNFNDVINNTLAERSHILVKIELLAKILAALIEAVELPTKTKLEIASLRSWELDDRTDDDLLRS